MAINNQPTIEPRTVTGIFTRYIAKTLPLAFDESMSYYECLCALLEYINQTIVPDINNVNDGLTELQTFYLELQDYVNHYFDNLDVQEEINNKLDNMVKDGSLLALISNYVDPIYQAYEEEINDTINDQNLYMNNKLNSMQSQIDSVTSGSPAGVYDTLSDLETADPDHSKIYVVLADGKWYYYNTTESAWTAGGTYQSSDVADGSITPPKFATFLDLSNYSDNVEVLTSTRLSGYDTTTNEPSLTPNSTGWTTYKFDISNMNNILKYAEQYNPNPENPGSHTICFLATAENKRIVYFNFNGNSNITGVTWTSTDRLLSIDLNTVKVNYPTAKYIYSCMFTYQGNGVDFISNSSTKLPGWLTTSNESDIDVINAKIDKINYVELDLPSRLTAVVGHEINFYKHAILKTNNMDQYDLRLIIPQLNGNSIEIHNYGDVIRFTPNAENISERECIMRCINKITQEVVKTKTFTLSILADYCPTTKIMFIGDSLTQNGRYPAEITKIMNTNIESIGTRSTTVTIEGQPITVQHEGRSGWSAMDYVNYSEYKGYTNSFWNPTTNKFDFSYYMNTYNFSSVDMVMLNLGTNGYDQTTNNINALQEMITSIHTYNPNIKIIVHLAPMGALQSGWGYNGNILASTFNYYITKLHKAINDNLVTTNVYVSAPYINVDSYNDFQEIQVPASSRNPKLITIENNTAHPNMYGYLKMADIYYNEILYYRNN